MRKYGLFRLLSAAGALALAGTASAGDVSVAGLYSTKHKVNIEDGSKVDIDGFLNIDSDGTMSVYGTRKSLKTGKDCYYMVGKSAINYDLQGQTLTAGTAPSGEPDYEVKLGQDRFGIFTQADAQGKFRWFYYRGADDATATVSGPGHTVNTGTRSFSVSGPRLSDVSMTDIQMARCDN